MAYHNRLSHPLDTLTDDHFLLGPPDDPMAYTVGPSHAGVVVPHQEMGPGKNFTTTKIGEVNHIVIKASYEAAFFVGSAKDDDITNKDQGKITIVGGGGNDIINSGNNTSIQSLYGDDVQSGFTIGNTYGKYGNDTLHVGAGDTGKSGNGFDKYVLHGPFQFGPTVIPAKLYLNITKDVLDMGNNPKVTSYEVTKYSADKSAVLLKSFTLTGHDDFFGPNSARIINPEVERGRALEGDALDMWVGTGVDHKISMTEVQSAVNGWEAKWDFIL